MSTDRKEALLNKKLRVLLKTARDHLSTADWDKWHFEQQKAYALALFSEIAYYKISEHEYRLIDRAKVIPCLAYQFAIASQIRIRFETVLGEADLEQFFVVESKNFVAIGLVLSEVVVIAVRGTRYLYDWMINFRLRRQPLYPEREGQKFHAGFLREAELLRVHLKERLARLDKRIVVTGHSLGGAVVAILTAIGGNWHRFDVSKVGSTYIFAAPRYAGLRTLLRIDNPFNCVSDFDLVPRLPPGLFGYSNSILEFGSDGSAYIEFEGGQQSTTLEWLRALFTAEFLRNHSIETYRRKIRVGLMPRP